MKICYPLAIFCAILLLPLTAFGHHGKEFLVTSTYKTPDKGKSFLLLSFDYIQANHHGRGFELEPGVLYGIFDQWSAEIHTHHGLFNHEFSFESIGVETRYRFFGAGDVQTRMTPGLYGSLFRAIDFRVGASFPISSHSEGFSARTILIYSF